MAQRTLQKRKQKRIWRTPRKQGLINTAEPTHAYAMSMTVKTHTWPQRSILNEVPALRELGTSYS